MILGLFKSSNPCTAIDCKFYSIFLIVSFILIAGLLWFTLSSNYKIDKEVMQHKNKIKEMIISSFFSKIDKINLDSDKQDKYIENLNKMLDVLCNKFIEQSKKID
jgi:hypothetical protein